MNGFLEEIYGLKLDKALVLVSSRGLDARLKETKPPGKITGLGFKRVIVSRKTSSQNLEIIWSYENYE